MAKPGIVGLGKNLYTEYNSEVIIADATAIAGGYVADDFNADGYVATTVGFGEASSYPDLYLNLSTEMWMYLADNIGTMMLPDDDILLSQLTTRRYKFTGKTNKQVVVE